MRRFIHSKGGFTLVELVIASGVMAVMMFAMMSMQTNQMKTNNFLEFQLKKTQLHGSILGQVISDPYNCNCLFNGAAQFPAAGTPELTGFTPPTAIGVFDPTSCATPIANPFITAAGFDGMKLISTKLRNIVPSGSDFTGDLFVNVESTKEILGPKELSIKIPVTVITAPGAPGSVAFKGCTTKGGTIATQLKIALSTIKAYEQMVCWRDNILHALTVACPAGKALLTCSGGPGDEDENHEGFWVLSDYTLNTCTLQIKRARCVFGESWTYQRIIANCYDL